MLINATTARADLIVKVDKPKTVGAKSIVKLTMKNTFKQRIESARAEVFLTDEKGKMVGQAARWVIGGTKDKPNLAPGATKHLFLRDCIRQAVAGDHSGYESEFQWRRAGRRQISKHNQGRGDFNREINTKS